MVLAGACRSVFSRGVAPCASSWTSSAFSDRKLGRKVKLSGCGRSVRETSGPVMVRAVLDKLAGSGGQSGSSGSSDPARLALESLFAQASRYEEKLADPLFESSEQNLEQAVSELEVDLRTAVEALRDKEEQLLEAEAALKEDQRELHNATSALYSREKELELASYSHLQRKEELRKTKEELAKYANELKQASKVVKQREEEVEQAYVSLAKLESELSRSRALMAEKDESLAKVATDLKSQSSKLRIADDFVVKQDLEIKSLRALVQEKESSLLRLQREKMVKQEKLEQTEAELEKRAKSWMIAQQELKALEQELKTERIANEELKTIKKLLAEVEDELEMSLASAETYRSAVEEQDLLLEKQDEEFNAQSLLLEEFQTNLEFAKSELLKERDMLKRAQASYETLQKEMDEAKRTVEILSEQLVQEKEALRDSVQLVNSLKADLQLKDDSLTDTTLALQLKEAELISAKLELQHVKSKFSLVQHNLTAKTRELEAAQSMVQELRKEVSQVKSLLQSKEEQLRKLTTLLQEKEEQLSIMRIDLDDSKVQLSEATSVVEQISALSRALVDSAKQGATSTHDDESVLMQTNLELFSANRSLLERELQLQHYQEKAMENAILREEVEAELEAVQECLKEKDNELVETREALFEKEQELKQVLARWESREKELHQLAEELMTEAKTLTSLRSFLQEKGDGARVQTMGPTEAMDLEIAKLEVESTLCALQSLADLSKQLVDKSTEELSSYSSPTSISLETNDFVESLKGQLVEKDSALELTKSALDSLTRLTERLVLEAGV
ncbi:hypothetical protein MPTK1_7g14770 [Marchantia polymorpha subsp. ruderalis]|uniref:Uncharacterized protein n=2 Tax=Marchantia polymorpha TaxID=3197 RepID=A0AAF6BZN4_MARPO|nr:hypothetical protein MARPO_0009s0162 [Marchantia polymorpha]BBN17468.1 hypothetical protein Mp_7g14770 [Marchantia polymorpha subsp. ruderalis]|eukprot:PTQ47074.1 hypothetical protein MARPO_0009s0162 [Marchantia polymorpha]